VTDDSFLLLFNAHSEDVPFRLPSDRWGEAWTAAVDTFDPALEEGSLTYKAGDEVPVRSRSIVVLRRAE